MVTRMRVAGAILAAALLAGCGPGAAPERRAQDAGRSGEVFTVTSTAFEDGGRIPEQYVGARAGGGDLSPPLAWSGAPEGTRSFLLTVVDHAPVANEWVHWAVSGIPAEVASLPQAASGSAAMPPGSREHVNTSRRAGWSGPSPPPGTGQHPYVVTVYALSSAEVTLPEAVTAEDIDRAVAGVVLDTAELTGVYSR